MDKPLYYVYDYSQLSLVNVKVIVTKSVDSRDLKMSRFRSIIDVYWTLTMFSHVIKFIFY
jgi:hypothetical protein